MMTSVPPMRINSTSTTSIFISHQSHLNPIQTNYSILIQQTTPSSSFKMETVKVGYSLPRRVYGISILTIALERRQLRR
jgi:hypothetical protein